ncbi:hypothetical protein RCIX680 [Methanocella arvoryzae MRE50]|uniref:Uncharacterized protein n=1 Tax=Methanocella arvoryzae (strain DSM 22066 / NBRC 105507 / MRE50) TaxID=351160 RepID=Q0W6C0_METAR|nr:hypothetical protein RCIX680 [Methanocella arvoryzae MRE50]
MDSAEESVESIGIRGICEDWHSAAFDNVHPHRDNNNEAMKITGGKTFISFTAPHVGATIFKNRLASSQRTRFPSNY